MHISAFFSGEVAPFWPHFWLILVAVLGSAAVAWGIIKEADRIWSLTTLLVVIGVAVEAICTILLFGFDEGISAAQQSKIFTLETCLAARFLSPDKLKEPTEKVKPFAGSVFDAAIGPRDDPEPLYLLRSIHFSLVSAGWKQIPWTTGDLLTEAPMLSVGETMVTNVIIDVGPSHWAKFGNAAAALAKALTDVGIEAVTDPKPTSIDNDAIHVRIGRRLCFAEPPRE